MVVVLLSKPNKLNPREHLKKIQATVHVSKQLGQKYVEEYIIFSAKTKLLPLKNKTFLLLPCTP
ncbi:hypothetical protein [Coleofasciculus chthonoplastes]|uniref:hypothetical protein n=1 Tax=Coleofasciculus chthonoplastes TaxID=64178 RepID=UPI0032F11B28